MGGGRNRTGATAALNRDEVTLLSPQHIDVQSVNVHVL
jgi:hypothetical protein